MKVLNIGSLNIDYVYQVDRFLQAGETKKALKRDVNCGGKGLNQSVALAAAGVEVYHAGKIGPEGKFLADTLSQAAVNTEFIAEGEESTGHAVIQVNEEGENCILIYSGANACLEWEEVVFWLDQFDPETDIVLLQNETNLVREIIEECFRRGLKTAWNAAPADASLLDYPLEKITWLFVNETEAAVFSRSEDLQETVHYFQNRCPQTEVILTLGSEGAVVIKDGLAVRQEAIMTEAVDTTAAGDTFTGYYLMARGNGSSVEEGLYLAAKASSITVGRAGAAASIPLLKEVQAARN